MLKQTQRIVDAADRFAKSNCGRGITPISTWRIRKEQVAHKCQQAEQIRDGLIGVWSCLESAFSYRARFCAKTGYPQLQNYATRCKHLYFYFDHTDYGFMNIRLQTWFPYHIQVCLNGREWLRRCLEQQHIDFLAKGNKLLYISDYQSAQNILRKQQVTLAGNPYRGSKDQVITRLTAFNDGVRVRHWVDSNSVKVYNEQNVLRVETTINNPSKFRVNRHKQGQDQSEPKARLALRKGVMDIPLRAIVSQEVNERFMDDLATLKDESPAYKLIDPICRQRTKAGRRFRALDPTGKDRELLQALSDPKFRISGITNKMLRQALSDSRFAAGRMIRFKYCNASHSAKFQSGQQYLY